MNSESKQNNEEQFGVMVSEKDKARIELRREREALEE